MRSSEVVEGLKEHHASPHLGAIFTEASALVLLFNHLPIDQIGVGCLHRLLGTSWFAGAWKGLQGMVDLDQRREITAEAIAEKARDAPDDSRCHLDELQSAGKRPWANKRR